MSVQLHLEAAEGLCCDLQTVFVQLMWADEARDQEGLEHGLRKAWKLSQDVRTHLSVADREIRAKLAAAAQPPGLSFKQIRDMHTRRDD